MANRRGASLESQGMSSLCNIDMLWRMKRVGRLLYRWGIERNSTANHLNSIQSLVRWSWLCWIPVKEQIVESLQTFCFASRTKNVPPPPPYKWFIPIDWWELFGGNTHGMDGMSPSVSRTRVLALFSVALANNFSKFFEIDLDWFWNKPHYKKMTGIVWNPLFCCFILRFLRYE